MNDKENEKIDDIDRIINNLETTRERKIDLVFDSLKPDIYHLNWEIARLKELKFERNFLRFKEELKNGQISITKTEEEWKDVLRELDYFNNGYDLDGQRILEDSLEKEILEKFDSNKVKKSEDA